MVMIMDVKKILILVIFLILLFIAMLVLFSPIKSKVLENKQIDNNLTLIDLSIFCDLNSPQMNYSPFKINECSIGITKVYSVGYGAPDYPDYIFRENKTLLAICGGMPLLARDINVVEDNSTTDICGIIECENGRTYKCK